MTKKEQDLISGIKRALECVSEAPENKPANEIVNAMVDILAEILEKAEGESK